MELTKEQQRIIKRYRRTPGFLKNRIIYETIFELQQKGMSREEAAKIVFQNSSRPIKTKNYELFAGSMWSNEDTFQDIIDFLENLPIQQQDKLLNDVSDVTLIRSIGYVSLEIQEKYFKRFISNESSMFYISSLNPEIKKHMKKKY